MSQIQKRGRGKKFSREEKQAVSNGEPSVLDLPADEKINQGFILSTEDIISKECLILLEGWRRDGITLREIEKRLGISSNTFGKIRKEYPEVENALKRGTTTVNYEVENALLKAALGYTKTSVKTYIENKPDKAGNRQVRMEKEETEVGPNATACIAWLNNKKPEEWKRNRDNFMIEAEDKLQDIKIQIIKGNGNDSDNESNESEE
jgi:hypothetical protein|nr:MAG TPA: terminase small subunit [Caudoviricetes sp.]